MPLVEISCFFSYHKEYMNHNNNDFSMTNQNTDDMSINEILTSIKKFVSAEEQEKIDGDQISRENKKEWESPSDFLEESVVKLSPVFVDEPSLVEPEEDQSVEEKMKALENLSMPNFIQKASKNREESPQEDQTFQEVKKQKETTCLNECDDRQTVKEIFQNFAETIKGMAKERESSSSTISCQGGLEKMVFEAIQKAVLCWLDQHMQPVVELLVKKEIDKITRSILSK